MPPRKMYESLSVVPSPNEWLTTIVQARQIAHSRVARLVGTDAKQVGRWLRGQEQIPRPQLAELAREFEPWQLEYPLALKDCEDLCDNLRRRNEQLRTVLTLTAFPHDAIRQRINDLLRQEPISGPYHRASLARHYLVDAIAATRIVRTSAGSGFDGTMLGPETVPRFRFPMNHFLGLLLELDQFIPSSSRDARAVGAFREAALGCLRKAAFRPPSERPLVTISDWFTMHVLARHGADDDRQRIRPVLEDRRRPPHPLLKRICLTGLSLADRKDARAIEELSYGLQHDSDLASINLSFHAFHYGDTAMDANGELSAVGTAWGNTVHHVLRHLEQRTQYGPMLESECVTLRHVLELAGTEPFKEPAIAHRLGRLLKSDTIHATQRRHTPVRDFYKRFHALVDGLR